MIFVTFCLVGVCLAFGLFLCSFKQLKIKQNILYQTLLLGGISFALRISTDEITSSFLLDLIIYAFSFSLSTTFLLFMMQIVGIQKWNLMLRVLLANLLVCFGQSFLYVTTQSEFCCNLVDKNWLLDTVMGILALQFMVSIYGLYFSLSYTIKVVREKPSDNFFQVCSPHILSMIGVTIFVLFLSMITGEVGALNPFSIAFFSLTFCLGCGFMLFLRYKNNFSDIAYLGLDSITFEDKSFSFSVLKSDELCNKKEVDSCLDVTAQTAHDKYSDCVEKLKKVMETEKYYLDSRLTIKDLSKKINLPEYKIRKLIIEHMDYKNFNSFVNQYRIDHAKYELKKQDNENVPIKTIVYSCGFENPETCFRIFKSMEGITPKQYRDSVFAK